MILQDEVVGVLSMWRTDVAPFNDHERELLEEFAAQGAIALRQVNLLRALESRGTELSSKVAQLEALREVGEAVGSSLDLDEVLDRIVGNAVRLTNRGFGDITLRTDGGSIMEYDESTESFHVHAVGSGRDLLERLRAITIHRDSTLVGRAALAHRPSAGSRPCACRARPTSGDPVPGRLALGARGSHAARRRHGGRAGDPAPGHRAPSRPS